MRSLLLLLTFLPVFALAQVRDGDIVLKITAEKMAETPYVGEMILLTIEGTYRLPITLEKLEQPDFEGFSWMQLGLDHWFESDIRGRKVKNMRRRMAVFPERAGRLEIGSFVHHLTLLDETGQRFQYDAVSEPVRVDAKPTPEVDSWWFPIRGLEITDNWSNAPDQLENGEGTLRVVSIRALGVSPEMLPPMPELKSPSAHIFPHPEKRLTDLTPEGPVAIAFWRWTVKPAQPPSAILEPIELDYFDTRFREQRTVSIAAQRIAFGDAGPLAAVETEQPYSPAGLLWLGVVLVGLVAGTVPAISGRAAAPLSRVIARLRPDQNLRAFRKAARAGDLAAMRRAAARLDKAAEPDPARRDLLARLDEQLYSSDGTVEFDNREFARRFLSTLKCPAESGV